MKRNIKFLTFLESIKTAESSALIESIKSGFIAINENYVDLEEDDVFNRHYGDDIQYGDLYSEIDGGEETEFDRELSDIANNDESTRRGRDLTKVSRADKLSHHAQDLLKHKTTPGTFRYPKAN